MRAIAACPQTRQILRRVRLAYNEGGDSVDRPDLHSGVFGNPGDDRGKADVNRDGSGHQATLGGGGGGGGGGTGSGIDAASSPASSSSRRPRSARHSLRVRHVYIEIARMYDLEVLDTMSLIVEACRGHRTVDAPTLVRECLRARVHALHSVSGAWRSADGVDRRHIGSETGACARAHACRGPLRRILPHDIFSLAW